MNLSPFLRTQHFETLSLTPCNRVSGRVVDREWQVAQERVLLYLRALETPAHEALELALEALRRAAKRPCRASADHPAASGMRALMEILSEQSPGFAASPSRRLPGDEETRFVGIRAMPPLNRGSMMVEKIGQRNWVAVLPRCVQQAVPGIWRSVVAGFFYLILALSFLMIIVLNV